MDVEKLVNKYKLLRERREAEDEGRFLEAVKFQNNLEYYEQNFSKNIEICRLMQEIGKHRHINHMLQDENINYKNNVRALKSKCKQLQTELYTQDTKIFSLQSENKLMRKLLADALCPNCKKKL